MSFIICSMSSTETELEGPRVEKLKGPRMKGEWSWRGDRLLGRR
jgi:hypothetical protein